jgi:hypothetical protein
MSKLSITDAAKAAGISRQTLYSKYINTGKISVEAINDKKVIDVSEIIRVFGNVNLPDTLDSIDGHYLTNDLDTSDRDKLIKLLESQLKKSEEREAKLQEQVNTLINQQTLFLDYKEEKPKRKKFLGIF